MTPGEIASSLRMAAAEIEDGREATAKHFVRKAYRALFPEEAAKEHRGPAPVARLRIVKRGGE
jgi:hypothetical protein